MRSKGHRQSRFHGSLQGFLQLFLIQITVFSAASCADPCIPVNLTETSYNTTSVTLSWIVPKDKNNTFISFVSLFSSANKTQNYTTTNKELTITGLSPSTTYSVSISSLCNGTESIPSIIVVQTGPSPPLDIMVVEQDIAFASVRWTAPNDPNKDSYTYHVKLYLNGYWMNYEIVHSTEVNFTHLVPGRNYTLTVTSSCNNKASQPATITFIAVPCGGKVRAEGWLSSPGYPQNIYSNMDCVWDIEAPLGHIVLLTVVDLNYYYYYYYYHYPSSWCYSSWLALGYTQTSHRDITMCRYSDIGRTITSPSNTLRVFYQTSFFSQTRRFNITLSSQDACIPTNLTETSFNTTSVTLSWFVPKDQNNMLISVVSLFSSASKTQKYTTTNKELTITGLSPGSNYSVSISSLCNGTESIPSTIAVQTGPSPPLNITVAKQDLLFASVRWTAPNDPNKDSYTYRVKLYQYGHWMNYRIVYSTEVNFKHLIPGRNYTLMITSHYNNKYSLPETITFTAVPCGGKVRAEGWLSSPGYPQNIYSNMDCVWDIEAPLGHVVLLTVVDLNSYYYSSSRCDRGWLALGYNQTSQRDITMCRDSDVGRTIISPSNTMRVFYYTSSYDGTRRFNVALSSQDPCIPTLVTVTSFNTTSVTLSWVVPKDQNNRFISFVSLISSGIKTQTHNTTNKELTITGLSLGSTYSVSISSLCNGTESIPSTIAVQTGPSPPLNITVAKQDWSFASVKWTAPNDPNKDSYTYRVMWYLRRYSMNYKTVYNTEINITRLVPGGNYTLTVTSYYNNKYSLPATITFTAVPCGGKVRAEGWLSSPGYPRNIYSNMDCVWDIEAPLGHVVLLTVVDLNSYYNNYYYYSSSRCYRGWLAVGYNQTSQRDITMCRYSDVGRTIISPSNTMRVFYYTSSYYGTRRFNVALSSQDSCIPAQLKVVSYNITSVTLSWIIPNDRNNTQLSFVSLLSSGKEIQNYTTMYKEQTITGLSPFIEYNVSISSLCHGTESIPSWINIETGPSPPTNLTVVEEGVGFASVRWTAPNDPNKDSYTYHVTLYHNGYSMNSRTVHSTEFTMTYLEPGYNYTVTVTSSDNNKASLPATITFTAVPCGGQLRAEGRLSSPDNPQNIYSNLHCFWDIEAPLGHVVLLTVVDLNYYYYYPSSECYGNWLAVGYNQTSQKDITMCHYSDVGRTIISTSNMLRVFYRKSFYYDAVRFNITLSSQEDPSLSSTASAGTEAGTDTTAIKSTSSVSTVESSTHPTSNTVKPEESSPSSSGVTQVGTDTTSHATHLTSTAVVVLLSIAAKVFCDSMGLT